MQRILPLERIHFSLASDWDLTPQEVIAQREKYGSNQIVEHSSHRWWDFLKHTLIDPMIWFLLIASILFIFLGELSDAIVLLLAIIPIGGMDAFLHWRTQASTRLLRSKLVTFVTVVRNHQEQVIPAVELVPGDLVLIKAGDYFPADGVLLQANHLQVDESSLTGEAFPHTKSPIPTMNTNDAMQPIGTKYWGLAGTHVLTGEGLMRVIYTGHETFYGKIITSILYTAHEQTPLQKAIARFVGILLIIAITFCLILAIVRYMQGFGVIDAILSAATLAVAALPDEFPMVFTVFLGVGVYRLAKKHALVRRGVSVENIGRVNFICTDKTGTITEGRFHVDAYVPAQGILSTELLFAAQLASRKDSGDPLDAALLTEQMSGHNLPQPLSTSVHPFTEQRKCETTIAIFPDQAIVAVKGAPETIFELAQLNAEARDYWETQANELAQQGLRVIACARFITDKASVHDASCQHVYQFLGLIGLHDPARRGVIAAVRNAQQNHIHIVMMTGDHPVTAKKIAADIGLGDGAPNVITAQEAEQIVNQHGPAFLKHIDVIARALPEQKVAIVKWLRGMQEIVAVTGDGINDVPALRAADVGIAMGQRGTQSAREAADIVLLDDNFDSIVNAIQEGKQLFKNLQRSFKYILMIHMPYVLSATIIPLLGFPLLYYPIHIVCIELFIHPTCMLVFQNLPEPSVTVAKPIQRKKLAFFNKQDWLSIATLGTYTTLVVISIYLWSLWTTKDEFIARANAFTAVGLTHIALTSGLSKLQTLTARLVVLFSILLLLSLVQIPSIAHHFLMQPPAFKTWCLLLLLSLPTFALALRSRK